MMDQRVCSISPADTGCSMESPAPDQQDAHSSEEELEVINNSTVERVSRPLRSASSLPEKRKWSQRGDSYSRRCSPENEENMSHYGNLSPCSRFAGMGGGAHSDDAVHPEHSSDEEVHALTYMAAPLQFRTSPPLEAVKPGRRLAASKIRSLSPPSKLMHYEESPRKRTRHAKHALQRPYLDFEKMQQVQWKILLPVYYFITSADSQLPALFTRDDIKIYWFI